MHLILIGRLSRQGFSFITSNGTLFRGKQHLLPHDLLWLKALQSLSAWWFVQELFMTLKPPLCRITLATAFLHLWHDVLWKCPLTQFRNGFFMHYIGSWGKIGCSMNSLTSAEISFSRFFQNRTIEMDWKSVLFWLRHYSVYLLVRMFFVKHPQEIWNFISDHQTSAICFFLCYHQGQMLLGFPWELMSLWFILAGCCL